MKVSKTTLFIFFLVGISANIRAQFVTVDDTYTAQQLVEDVLINSPCANVENFTINGDPFNPGQQSYGFFDGNGSSFPFTNGIVLSTARANRSGGPNDNLIDEGLPAWTGDADLEQALGISNTLNATVLEFDFTPLVDQVSFDYIFASEEYQGTAPCHYSDGFAFLLRQADVTTPYTNLAVLPNSNIPVLVTSVHPQIGGSNGCPAKNESFFGGYNNTNAPINFNGQTVVLTAKSTVIPNVKYHIKLVIADHENIRYDSAIFLGGGSFKVGADLGQDRLISNGNPICAGATYTLDTHPQTPDNNTYEWYKNDVLLNSETNSDLDVVASGTYKVKIFLAASTCVAESEVKIEYAPALNPTAATIVQCDDNNDGITVFDITKAASKITSNDPDLSIANYFEDANQLNPIGNPTSYSSAPKTIYALVVNSYNCSVITTINLVISNNTIAPQNPIATCDGDMLQDGFYHFDLDNDVTPQIVASLPPGLIVNYFASENDAATAQNPLSSTFENTTAFQEIIWARIINGPDCYGIIPITLIINTFSPPDFEDENKFLCDGDKITLSVPMGYAHYSWNDATNSGLNHITIDSQGTYTVIVTDDNGCTAMKKFIVNPSGIATIDDIVISDFMGGANTVAIIISGNGIYEYSLDGGVFQNDAVFNDVASGAYTVYVNDKNGCGVTQKEFFVLDYPKFFTPNGDGFNDFWKVPFLQFYPQSRITIFDRYGKLLSAFRGNAPGWDGKLGSSPLPATDYWFVITIEERTIRGHFSLKR
ncbi:MAG: choice-of-anchor L domain-containing protein [Flavobacterium sp.]|nr:choice-of-anchor L domain-containing protein [Flavobacterium sp.]